jgi:hypothetical protein
MKRKAAASTSIRLGFCSFSHTFSMELITLLLAVFDDVEGAQISGSELK